MGEVYRFLNLTVGCIQNGQIRKSGACSTTATLLMDERGKWASITCAQRHGDHARATGPSRTCLRAVDEVDSILIDEARVPLIIAARRRSARTSR